MDIYELILEKLCKFTQQNTNQAKEVYISHQKLQRIIKDEELYFNTVFIYPEKIFGLKIKIWNSYKIKVS